MDLPEKTRANLIQDTYDKAQSLPNSYLYDEEREERIKTLIFLKAYDKANELKTQFNINET